MTNWPGSHLTKVFSSKISASHRTGPHQRNAEESTYHKEAESIIDDENFYKFTLDGTRAGIYVRQ